MQSLRPGPPLVIRSAFPSWPVAPNGMPSRPPRAAS